MMRRDHAPHDGMRLPAWMRRWVNASGLTCLLTGLLWLLFHHAIRIETDFGTAAHPLEHAWLALHGGAAIAAAWAFGLIWLAHVRRGWHSKRNRTSGVTMAMLLLLLLASGWGLYYLGDESWRTAVGIAHWSTGLLATAWLPMHRWRGRRHIH